MGHFLDDLDPQAELTLAQASHAIRRLRKEIVRCSRDARNLQLIRGATASPASGKDLLIVAEVDDALHFRKFDGNGDLVLDVDEKALRGQAQAIGHLRKQLAGLWPPHVFDEVQKRSIIDSVAAIVDHLMPGIVGQSNLIDRVLQAIILAEHCLIEGNPGVAKTMTCQMTGEIAGLAFKRVQFIPDMMPSDLVMTERLEYVSGKGIIVPKPGPIFTNLLLADEINRASPKVQAALLEATEERHVTPLNQPRQVIRPVDPDEAQLLRHFGPYFGEPRKFRPETADGQVFVVLATQNPIEQEGVYPLSRAQEDRFAYKVIVEYPAHAELEAISRHAFGRPRPGGGSGGEEHVKTLYFFARLRSLLLGPAAAAAWFNDHPVREKTEALVDFTHYRSSAGESPGRMSTPGSAMSTAKSEELKRLVSGWGSQGGSLRHRATTLKGLIAKRAEQVPEILSGASPRGLLKIVRAAHAEAFLKGDDGADMRPTWEHIKAVAGDVLRHRIRLAPGAEAMGREPDEVIDFVTEWIDQW